VPNLQLQKLIKGIVLHLKNNPCRKNKTPSASRAAKVDLLTVSEIPCLFSMMRKLHWWNKILMQWGKAVNGKLAAATGVRVMAQLTVFS